MRGILGMGTFRLFCRYGSRRAWANGPRIGGGYWINPGPSNHNWWFTGFVVQREVLPHLTPGIEFFHGTSQVVGGPHETGINLGLIWDFTDTQHIVLSAGPAIEGPNQLQGYLAYALTFATNP